MIMKRIIKSTFLFAAVMVFSVLANILPAKAEIPNMTSSSQEENVSYHESLTHDAGASRSKTGKVDKSNPRMVKPNPPSRDSGLDVPDSPSEGHTYVLRNQPGHHGSDIHDKDAASTGTVKFALIFCGVIMIPTFVLSLIITAILQLTNSTKRKNGNRQ